MANVAQGIAQIESLPSMPPVPVTGPKLAHQPSEQRFLMRGIDWATYRKISDALDGRHFRLTYDRGNLEFMTTSSTHGHYSSLVARLIYVLTEEIGLFIFSCGDMTCDREELERGLEPDECFYIQNEPLIRTKERIDLSTDPPPDLAVEIDISRSSRKRLSIYEALGVPEVWRFDGETLFIYQLGAGGQYAPAEHSRHFPFVIGTILAQFVLQGTQQDENSLVRSFREWVQEQLRTRG